MIRGRVIALGVISLALVAAASSVPLAGASTRGATERKANQAPIVVEQSSLTYLPGQTGGNFHTLVVLVRNTSSKVALEVGGQISILGPDGELVESLNPNEINILPKSQGLFVETALDLPVPMTEAKIKTKTLVGSFRKGPRKSPVGFSNLVVTPEESLSPELAAEFPPGCTVSGTVSNTFSEPKENLQIRVATFAGGKLVTGDFTYVDHVFPKTDATFEVDLIDASLCPAGVDEVLAIANLGDDKIFNP